MGVDGDTVLIEEEGELLRIPLGQIDTARLVPDI
jgi:ribosome maturation factor RimP